MAAGLVAEIGIGMINLGGLKAAWLAEALADIYHQAMASSPAGRHQPLVFANLSA